ncbi:MAG: LysR substrate-binding domain-containing protein [Burkholderiales bacterium]|nr:LysR substrate-binding domain-containing protein [Burkholderiales bacterium]
MDSLTSIRVYCAVVESASFAAAARRLKLSRAVVTKHVSSLEDRLHVRLLERTTRKLSVTEAGGRYYDRAVQILAELEDAEREAQQATAVPRGTLRLSAPHHFGTAHIAPFLAEFRRRHPEVELDVSLSDRFIDLIEEGFDLAIRISDTLAESSLVARRLAPCRFVVCGSPEYFKRHGEPRVPDDLARHACLGYTLSPRERVWNFACAQNQRHVVNVSGPLRSNSGDVLRVSAASGIGVMLLPTFFAGSDLESGRLKAVLTDYRVQEYGIYAVYLSRKHLSAKVKAFIDFLAEKYGPEPYWDEWLRALPAPSKDACAASPSAANPAETSLAK